MTDIVVITGSPSGSSRSAALASALTSFLELHGVNVSQIELKGLPAEDLLHANFESEAIRKALAIVKGASIVVLATPIYKVAYSGLLKSFLDLLPQDGLSSKKVIALASGGTSGHRLALDYSLRPVLASLGASEVLANVYAVDSELVRLEDGEFLIHDDILRRLKAAADHAVQVLLPDPALL